MPLDRALPARGAVSSRYWPMNSSIGRRVGLNRVASRSDAQRGGRLSSESEPLRLDYIVVLPEQ